MDTHAHRQLADEAAEQTLVLLQNKRDVLPLQLPDSPSSALGQPESGMNIAVVGPYATLTQDLLGEADYVSQNTRVDRFSLTKSLQNYSTAIQVHHAPGCSFKDNCNSSAGVARAVELAKRADVLVLALGLVSCGTHANHLAPTECESEGHDRFTLTPPGAMPLLVEQTATAVSQGVPVVCVLFHGGQLAIETLVDHCDAIIDAHHPGQTGEMAVVRAMFGAVNPSGRLASTIYPAIFTTADRPNMTDMRMRGGPATAGGLPASLGVTYMHYPPSKALFEFGHGLSFSKMTFSWAEREVDASADGAHSVVVRNAAGGPAGATVVLGFVSSSTVDGFPIRRLFDFNRTGIIAPGESARVTLRAPRDAFALSNAEGIRVVTAGKYVLSTGEPKQLVTKTVIVPSSWEGPVLLAA